MATKASVKALAKRQGATYTEGKDTYGYYWACITLPTGKVWDNGYGVNECHKSLGAMEELPDFWLAFEDELSAPLVDG